MDDTQFTYVSICLLAHFSLQQYGHILQEGAGEQERERERARVRATESESESEKEREREKMGGRLEGGLEMRKVGVT